MNNKTWIVPTAVALVAVGVACWQITEQRAEAARAHAAQLEQTQALESLGAKLLDMSSRLEKSEARVAELANRPALAGATEARVSADAIAAAVERYMDEHAAERAIASAAPASAPTGGKAVASSGALDLPATLKGLLDPALSEMDRDELWQKIREAGRLDEAVAWFEQRAAEAPNDPNAQVELGTAYVQKILEVGSGPLAGKWAMKADGAWDRALELDDHHWEARFRKAIGLSFWPPIFGKQGQAIAHFETLVAQQEAGVVQPHFVETYKLLGNMYVQAGKPEQATALWKKGLELFPTDPDLLAKSQGK
jgi:tetratricopeptide (TPR) repeat protein